MRQFNLKVLLILSLGHLVVDIYQGALPAILPFLKEKLELSYALTGMILMASNFTSSILQPLFGYVSDKKAMAFLLPLGLLAAGVGFSLLPFSGHLALILGLVVISGLGVASYHPEGYKTAHFFTGQRAATGMSIFSVGGNIGFSLGPILSMYII
ncbi:MAG: MFS transporter, partial [Syntrophorhabdaceae bacterium]|nr:MFS transporter [Syntrophorhabdaceae bacterium]